MNTNMPSFVYRTKHNLRGIIFVEYAFATWILNVVGIFFVFLNYHFARNIHYLSSKNARSNFITTPASTNTYKTRHFPNINRI